MLPYDIQKYVAYGERYKQKWEREHSSLHNIDPSASYASCRNFSTKSISEGLTKIPVRKGQIIEVKKGEAFHLLGQVDDGKNPKNVPARYFGELENLKYKACSTLNNENVSHYTGRVFFLYDVMPSEIVHVFPMDSCTYPYANEEEELTWMPSLWLSISHLEEATRKLETYNQITCKTKRRGKLIKPYAIAAFERLDDYTRYIADVFGLGVVVLHPEENAIKYVGDILDTSSEVSRISPIMKMDFQIDPEYLLTITECM